MFTDNALTILCQRYLEKLDPPTEPEGFADPLPAGFEPCSRCCIIHETIARFLDRISGKFSGF